MRIIIPAVILISSGVLMDGTVQAGTWTDNNDDGFLDASEKAALSEWFTPEKVSVGLSVGTLSGSAKERVYDNGRRLSQLDWKFKNAPILKGTIDWDITPWVRLGASGWVTAGSHGASDIIDRDWMFPDQDRYTHISDSPSKLLSASSWDVNATVWGVSNDNWRLGLMAGWQQTDYKWDAHGGYYSYWNGLFEGNFPNKRIGLYKPQFKMPYIGLTGGIRFRNIEMNTTVKYSHWVRASDTDEHYLRELTIRDSNRDSDFYSVSADIGYYITPQAKVFLEGEWVRITNGTGNKMQTYHDTGEVFHFQDASGIESSSYNVTAGLKYYF
ncbi:omptin family outer membrane protease [Salmonella enterica]|uniref:omptin family outer membrane protease n=2 Tax=Salmonella TaxID=590 RepID=UPI00034C0EE7|nr:MULTISPECIES: omptin family outer membrane protease [Salmonella]EGP3502165.1 omptin family outer membrane protease [Salmonella enterica subsp. enterica serovar Newport]EKY5349824.1 omptin family outer membrane protease [Salmonella enterica]MBO1965962.1 omptin family outer membrane protease [Salmonella sp. 32040203-2019-00173]